ncbi:MAG: hypothetical protein U9N02_05585 [Campylobacterota bacterium]|nr:hypothetical protein [Campylobacterota bacterium]
MKELEKDIIDGNLTQKEIIQLLLHNAQHMATRDEVKADIKELKVDIKQDYKDLKIELKQDYKDLKTELKQDISKVETTLKQDNKNLSKRMDRFMFWSLGLTITSTFLILGLIYKTIP